jgi:hypothetical protein
MYDYDWKIQPPNVLITSDDTFPRNIYYCRGYPETLLMYYLCHEETFHKPLFSTPMVHYKQVSTDIRGMMETIREFEKVEFT